MNQPTRVEAKIILPTKKIALHPNEDLDALTCLWLAKRFGQNRFPGIDQAEIIHWPDGKIPKGMNPAELRSQGIIAFDVGRVYEPYLGLFDHHNLPGLRDKSASDLLAQWLGLRDQPEFQLILNHISHIDGHGDNQAFGLNDWLRDYRLCHPKDRAGLRLSFFQRLDDKYRVQHYFHQVVAKEYQTKAQFFQIGNWIWAVIASDLNLMGYPFSRWGKQIDGFVQIRPSNNVQIMINQKLDDGLDLREMAKCVRSMEAQKQGQRSQALTAKELFDELGSADSIPMASQWHLAVNREGRAWALMNGSAKVSQPASQLTPEDLVLCLNIAFSCQLAPDCPQGHCLKNRCSWFCLGLARCRQIHKL